MDPNADAVQPDEGQGGQAPDSPYQSYLDRIPEEARAPAEEAFKAWDADTTRKFQEHAEYRKTLEPYEQLGITNVDPQAVSSLLEFQKALQENPDQVKQWAIEQFGLSEAQAAQITEPDLGYQDPDVQNLLKRELEQALSPLQQQLQEITGWRQQQETAAHEAEALRGIERQFADLESKNKDFHRGHVELLLPKYIEADPQNAVTRAWDDYQAMRNELEKSFLQGKADAPAPPAQGGTANAGTEPITTLEAAKAAAAEMLRAANQA